MQFFCHRCETIHTAAKGMSAVCDVYDEIIAERIPDDLYWCFCCGCQTFWRLDHFRVRERSLIIACIVCDRSILEPQPTRIGESGKVCPIVSYLCHSCNTVSIQTAETAKGASVLLNGSHLSGFRCPGCQMTMIRSHARHNCQATGLTLTTSRTECYFCGDILSQEEPGAPSSSSIPQTAESDPPLKLAAAAGKAEGLQRTRSAVKQFTKGNTPSFGKAPTHPDNDRVYVAPNPASPSFQGRWHRYKKATAFFLASLGVASAVFTAALLLNPALKGEARDPAELATAVTESSAPRAATPLPPDGMVYIPGGVFRMGTDTGDAYESPAHLVKVAPFFMDQTEVTVEEYAMFVNATGHRMPPDWKGRDHTIVAARKPVTGVDWHDANSYAKWAGKRLPTEVEWEFAARGTDNRLYPWGNEWRSNSANADVTSRRGMLDVGTLPDGASPFGVFDMVGNAWEWTASAMQAYPGGKLPVTVPQDNMVIRGGSWKDDRTSGATATYRGYLRASDSLDYSVTGFRCVKDVSHQ